MHINLYNFQCTVTGNLEDLAQLENDLANKGISFSKIVHSGTNKMLWEATIDLRNGTDFSEKSGEGDVLILKYLPKINEKK